MFTKWSTFKPVFGLVYQNMRIVFYTSVSIRSVSMQAEKTCISEMFGSLCNKVYIHVSILFAIPAILIDHPNMQDNHTYSGSLFHYQLMELCEKMTKQTLLLIEF